MITEQQKKEILESDDYDKYCGEFHCVNCPLDEFKDCAEGFYKIKLEAEKAKVEKLKKALEIYSDSKQWHGENKYYTSLDSDAEKNESKWN